MRRILLLIGLIAIVLASGAQAHEVRPSYLEFRQTAPETYDMLFKVPALGDELRFGLYVVLPEGTQDVVPPRAEFSGNAHLERRTIKRAGELIGQQISIDGLSTTFTDVLMRIEDIDGRSQTERLTPASTSLTSSATPSSGEVALTYFLLGIGHILFGFDHLLFVLALVILVRTWRRIAITVTAFTIAHSITLATATLGFDHVPGPPVEATIALSIMLVAAEIINAQRGQESLTIRSPWLVAFAFGLLHGLGFAGALSEVGLPEYAIPLALLFFNLGVEARQLAFVAAVLIFGWTTRQVFEQLRPQINGPAFGRVDIAIAYFIGTLSAYWTIERTAGLLS